MSIAYVSLSRVAGETYAIVRDITMTEDQLLTMGYASLAAAASAIGAATIRLVIGTGTPLTADADVSVVQNAASLTVTVTIQPPSGATATAQTHDQYLIFAPGSSTNARRIWQGQWVVEAAPEAS